MRNSRSCKLGDPQAKEILVLNAKILQGLFSLRTKKCSNPECQWPLDEERVIEHRIVGLGEVCSLCHEMHKALGFMNLGLTNSNYFKKAHEDWEKQIKDSKERRKRMGLDDEGDKNAQG